MWRRAVGKGEGVTVEEGGKFIVEEGCRKGGRGWWRRGRG